MKGDCVHMFLRPFVAQIICKHHDVVIAGHFGWRKLLHAVSQWYDWDTMQADVDSFVRACPHSQPKTPATQPT